ncbi:MAG: SDR family oxidoreductase [Crocinitomicaceae bacterium]|nr:SDR family oxidoreductase [Crocinitomicaceae bacterium]
MRILITGSNGLLGQKIVNQLNHSKVDFLATSKGENRNSNCHALNYVEMDIANQQEVETVFEKFKPTHVIHTAAMTNVDQCEQNPIECNRVNFEAVQLLMDASLKVNAHFQLLSTDFVFDGEKGNYSENDTVNPLSVYAHSKVNAENYLLQSDFTNWSIVRTIIVYGTAENLSRNNIVYWAKEALENGQKLAIIDDQFRAPTWADDLAWACIRICSLNKKGIYHISGPETFSIFEIVQKIADFFQLSTENLTKSSSLNLNQPAKRPPKTGFDISKATIDLGYKPKTLEETFSIL